MIWFGIQSDENYDECFGGVVLFNKEHFIQVNGYSNEYWGWGYEDVELLIRCGVAGLPVDRRDGTYRAWPHPSDGVGRDHKLTAEGANNLKMLRQRLPELRAGKLHRDDGLSNLEFQLRSSKPAAIAESAPANHVWIHNVDV